MLRFQGFWTVRRALAGIEAMAMFTKGQVCVVPANNVPAQRIIIHRVFGVAP